MNIHKIVRMVKKGAEGWVDNGICLTDVVAFYRSGLSLNGRLKT